MKDTDNLNKLHFEEFLEICSDSEIIDEETARRIINFAKAIGGVGSVPRLSNDQLNDTSDFSSSLVSTYPEDMTFNNYVTTEENYYATEIARTIALIPRVWKSITPVMLHAQTGQGKTHLLAAIARSTHKSTLILNTVDLHFEYLHCLNAGLDRELRDWITSYDLLMLDDIQFSQGDLQFQKFLISIINRMPRGKYGIITSSDVHPAKLLDIDSSFYSRLTSGLVIKLETVNIEGRKEILKNLFSQTGIKPDDDIIEFIADNVKMNVRQLKAAGRMVVAQMLGPSHDVTIDTVRDILSFMQIHRKYEHFPKASELNVKVKSEAPVTIEPSPFIVVDIDEEIKFRESPESDPAATKEIEPEKILKPEKLAAVTDQKIEPEKSPEPVPVYEQDKSIELHDEDHIFKEETGDKPSDDHTSTERYKNLVESAQTVDRQVEALMQAVADRIEQLEKRNTDSREVDKLRSALAFLKKGQLESAMSALKPD
jgi:chromosomal replication initiation ATPase DnaA